MRVSFQAATCDMKIVLTYVCRRFLRYLDAPRHTSSFCPMGRAYYHDFPTVRTRPWPIGEMVSTGCALTLEKAVAALFMSVSSVIVAINVLLLRRFRLVPRTGADPLSSFIEAAA